VAISPRGVTLLDRGGIRFQQGPWLLDVDVTRDKVRGANAASRQIRREAIDARDIDCLQLHTPTFRGRGLLLDDRCVLWRAGRQKTPGSDIRQWNTSHFGEATDGFDTEPRESGQGFVRLHQLVETGGARRGLGSRRKAIENDDPAGAERGELIGHAQAERAGADDDRIGLGYGKRLIHRLPPNSGTDVI
jgi:hypothetical protein